MTDAAGIYVHLPYCRSRCGYCAFVVSTDDSSRGEYLEALTREAAILSEEASGRAFDSIYLGGGTPVSSRRPSSVAFSTTFAGGLPCRRATPKSPSRRIRTT